jgi:hypothetical protein
MRRAASVLVAFVFATPALAVELHFCWLGADGYRMSGKMAFPDELATADLVTETDVTSFEITGYHFDQVVGHWSIAQLRPETSWNLSFLPREMAFVTGGYSNSDGGQEWNANGYVEDCGNPGFGFNSGAGAQDICINGRFMFESSIASAAPFPAQLASDPLACDRALQLSRLAG